MTQSEAGNGQQDSDPPGTLPAPGGAPAPLRGPSPRAWFIVVFAAVAVLLVGLVVWLLTTANLESLRSNDVPTPGAIVTTTVAPPTPLPLPREATAPEFRLGDCFSDFRPEAERSTIVACDNPHSAQFVANYTYEDGEVYPGVDALKAKALEACQAVTLSPAANEYVLNFERVYPSTTSWEVGDRRVDCFVVAPEGNIITTSVLP